MLKNFILCVGGSLVGASVFWIAAILTSRNMYLPVAMLMCAAGLLFVLMAVIMDERGM